MNRSKPRLSKKNRYLANSDALYFIESGVSMELNPEDSLQLSPGGSTSWSPLGSQRKLKASHRSRKSGPKGDSSNHEGSDDNDSYANYDENEDIPFYEDDGESVRSWNVIDDKSAQGVGENAQSSEGFETPSIAATPSVSSSRATSAHENERQQLVSEKLSGLVHAIKHVRRYDIPYFYFIV